MQTRRWRWTNWPGQCHSQRVSTNVAGCGKQSGTPGYWVTELLFLLHEHVRMRVSYAQIPWWGCLVPPSAGVWMSWLPPWRIWGGWGWRGGEITWKGRVTPPEPGSLDGRAAGSPAAGRQPEGLPRARGARLVRLALKAPDRTVRCTHVSRVLLAKVPRFSFM